MLKTLKLTNKSLDVIKKRISKMTTCLDKSSELAYRLEFGFDNDRQFLMVDMNNLPKKRKSRKKLIN